jgi:uncharacterized protein (TIGR00255 family)
MIKSMTGFGQSSYDDDKLQVNVEVRTLNSKFLDIGLRLPKAFSDKELEIRNMISEKLERGKVSLTIEYQPLGPVEAKQTYNEPLFIAYYSSLKKLADKVYAPLEGVFQLALNSPDVVQSNMSESADDEDWWKVKQTLEKAFVHCDQFRVAEGNALESRLVDYCSSIKSSLGEVDKLDTQRVEKVRAKLKGNVVSFFGEEGYDVNRLEQEIIFYIEKLDISEEKVRLTTHLDYFLQILGEKQSNGKKLGFISQEIGREINTIGSKANDAHIQKHVVSMKEELEKIKEQINNVL